LATSGLDRVDDVVDVGVSRNLPAEQPSVPAPLVAVDRIEVLVVEDRAQEGQPMLLGERDPALDEPLGQSVDVLDVLARRLAVHDHQHPDCLLLR